MSLTNLACFGEEETKVPLGPLTVITGPNNAGKSTILTACHMMRMSLLIGHPGWNTVGVPYRNFEDAVYGHDSRRRISLGATNSGSNKVARFEYGSSSGVLVTVDQITKAKLVGLFTTGFGYVSFQRERIATILSVGRQGGSPIPHLFDPAGADVVQFYLERFTDRDEKYDEAADWLSRIDPSLTKLKSPLTKQGHVSLVSTLVRGDDRFDVNFSFQGMGIQNAAILVAALVFSPKGSTILIEEPENHLHPGAIEVIGDLLNHVVLHDEKQVILTTHSRNLINVYLSDVGPAAKRGAKHVRMVPERFEMLSVELEKGHPKVTVEDLTKTTYLRANSHLKELLG